jgi:hypothetical protein
MLESESRVAEPGACIFVQAGGRARPLLSGLGFSSGPARSLLQLKSPGESLTLVGLIIAAIHLRLY